ncbi:hypothetical protein AGIG_G8972 [Arapaima gigas]
MGPPPPNTTTTTPRRAEGCVFLLIPPHVSKDVEKQSCQVSTGGKLTGKLHLFASASCSSRRTSTTWRNKSQGSPGLTNRSTAGGRSSRRRMMFVGADGGD